MTPLKIILLLAFFLPCIGGAVLGLFSGAKGADRFWAVIACGMMGAVFGGLASIACYLILTLPE